MYPSVPGAHEAPRGGSYGYGNSMPSTSPAYPPPGGPPLGATAMQQQQQQPQQQLASAGSLENSLWGADSNSTLRVKIADDFKLAPPVQVPPALAASSHPQHEFDFDLERSVMAHDASASFDAFLSQPETAYYENTKANKFTRAGFSPAIVNLALAHHAATRGDESQIMQFCENLKTLTQDMSFGLSLAAGALFGAKNDLSAAANLCMELS